MTSYSLKEYLANNPGQVFLAPFKDAEGAEFLSLVIFNGQATSYIGFSKDFPWKTVKDLISHKDEIRVLVKDSGRAVLCKSSWQFIDFGF